MHIKFGPDWIQILRLNFVDFLVNLGEFGGNQLQIWIWSNLPNFKTLGSETTRTMD
jgi:hypothetical protein